MFFRLRFAQKKRSKRCLTSFIGILCRLLWAKERIALKPFHVQLAVDIHVIT